jgi:hypothetical protein
MGAGLRETGGLVVFAILILAVYTGIGKFKQDWK